MYHVIVYCNVSDRAATPPSGSKSLDMLRSAAFYGVPFSMPNPFPIATQNPARAALWMQQKHPAHAKKFILELYRAFFRGNRDISQTAVIGDIATGLGYSATEVIAATQDETIKAALKANVEAAIAKGVFGAPFFIVDDEQFWGADRMPMLEQWLTKGAWLY